MDAFHISFIEAKTEWRDIPEDIGPVVTHCCHCRMDAADARFRKLISHDGYVVTQQVECKPDRGCYANPRRRIGMWNRPHPEYDE
jgi:hypothetical protein